MAAACGTAGDKGGFEWGGAGACAGALPAPEGASDGAQGRRHGWRVGMLTARRRGMIGSPPALPLGSEHKREHGKATGKARTARRGVRAV